jgi:signal peptidase II
LARAAEYPSKTATSSRGRLAPKAAFRRPSAVAVFLLLSAAALAADLWTKHAVFEALLSDPSLPRKVRSLVAGYDSPPAAEHVLRLLRIQRPVFRGLSLTLSTNPGVVFGLPMPPAAVAVATVFTIVLVGYFFASSDAVARWTHVALALILAGAVGNFYDRMLAAVAVPGIEAPITGQVRDFLDFSEIRVFGLNYPYIFNIADVLLVVGVAMLILGWFLAGRGKRKAKCA